jgi:hypothetical protein
MSKAKRINIEVQGTTIGILSRPGGDYISLTDMVRNFDGAGALIEQWLKNKDTVLFLGIWERINNPSFNSLEFEGIKNEAGRNSFFLSAKKWIDLTGAQGLIASAGRYGGTYAHKDIAFEFGSWLSPEFKLYLIKEFQRLKDEENERLKLEWNLQRTLAKINYRTLTGLGWLGQKLDDNKRRHIIFMDRSELLDLFIANGLTLPVPADEQPPF